MRCDLFAGLVRSAAMIKRYDLIKAIIHDEAIIAIKRDEAMIAMQPRKERRGHSEAPLDMLVA